MKVKVSVKGQITSAFDIENRMHGYTEKLGGRPRHYGDRVTYFKYNSKKDAMKALRYVWERLKMDDMAYSDDSFNRKTGSLWHDAANAVIERIND